MVHQEQFTISGYRLLRHFSFPSCLLPPLLTSSIWPPRYHHNTRQCACTSTSITSKATSRDYPPMNRQYLDCRCALYPDGHSVLKTEKLKHTLELKNARIRVSLFYMILSTLFQLEVELESSRSMLQNVYHYPKRPLQRHIPWIWMN